MSYTTRTNIDRKDHRPNRDYANEVIRRLDIDSRMKARGFAIERNALSRDACQPFDCALRTLYLNGRRRQLNTIQFQPVCQIASELRLDFESLTRGQLKLERNACRVDAKDFNTLRPGNVRGPQLDYTLTGFLVGQIGDYRNLIGSHVSDDIARPSQAYADRRLQLTADFKPRFKPAELERHACQAYIGRRLTREREEDHRKE